MTKITVEIDDNKAALLKDKASKFGLYINVLKSAVSQPRLTFDN